jgi:hypothetical protein
VEEKNQLPIKFSAVVLLFYGIELGVHVIFLTSTQLPGNSSRSRGDGSSAATLQGDGQAGQ